MAEQSSQDKTEKATPKRREEAQEKGNVPKSTELNSVAVLFAGIITFKIVSDHFSHTLNGFIVDVYRNLSFTDVSINSFGDIVVNCGKVFFVLLAPLLTAVLAVSFAVNFGQTGFMFAKKALKPDFGKLNPGAGLKRLVSVNSLIELLKGLLKIAIVSVVAYSVVSKYVTNFMYLVNDTVGGIIMFAGKVIMELSIKVGVALIFIALADYAYQRWRYEKDLKMTKQEVRDESKDVEGNPQVKGKIRSKQREISRNRMMGAVPDATVVVTNPTHIAVALKYDPSEKGAAPTVVAKGQRKLAEKIKAIARENGVPVIENKPLARSLFKMCEVGSEIPAMFYQTVAEILAQIYKAKHKNIF